MSWTWAAGWLLSLLVALVAGWMIGSWGWRGVLGAWGAAAAGVLGAVFFSLVVEQVRKVRARRRLFDRVFSDLAQDPSRDPGDVDVEASAAVLEGSDEVLTCWGGPWDGAELGTWVGRRVEPPDAGGAYIRSQLGDRDVYRWITEEERRQ